MATSLCDVALRGVWNASTEGHHYVDIDMTLQMKSGPDSVLPVLMLDPEMEVEILHQGIYELKREPSNEPDYGLGLWPREEGPDDQTYDGEKAEESEGSVSINCDVASRKLVTRDMRISPAPVKRLFPPSPDTCGGYDADDGSFDFDDNDSSGSSAGVRGVAIDDNDVFDESGHEDCEQRMQDSPGNAQPITIKRGLQPRSSFPEFDLDAVQDIGRIDEITDDKENDDPKGEAGYERQFNRDQLMGNTPRRDSTAVLISACTPGKEEEEPDTTSHEHSTPQSRVPNKTFVIPKRKSRSPQKCAPSKIPIKRMHKEVSSESEGAVHVVDVVRQANNLSPAQITHKRNSPLSQITMMTGSISNATSSGIKQDYEAKDGNIDATNVEESFCRWPDMRTLEMETPTRPQFSRRPPNQGSEVQDGNEEFTWPAEHRRSGAMPSLGQDNQNENSSNDLSLESSKNEVYLTPEEAAAGTFDVDEFYVDDDEPAGSTLKEGYSYEENNTIGLPSPSTASQRSLKWHRPGQLTERESLGELPVLEAFGGMLRVRTSSQAVLANLGLIATIRVTLTGDLKRDSEMFRASLPEDDGHISIQWELRLKPPQVDGWALELIAMLPFDECDPEYDSYVAEHQENPEAGHGSEMEVRQEESNNARRCPCCLYHSRRSPLVNIDRLMDVANGFAQKLKGPQALLHGLFKPCGKAIRFFGDMLQKLCGEEGLIQFIVTGVKFTILVLFVLFVIGFECKTARWSADSWNVNLRSRILSPMSQKPAVCCGMERAAGGQAGQSVDITGKEVAGDRWPSTAARAVLQPDSSGGAINIIGGSNSTENGSLTTAADTASTRAPSEAQLGAEDGDAPVSEPDAGADAADEGTNVGSGKADDKANDAGNASLRDRVDWLLGWRGPLAI